MQILRMKNGDVLLLRMRSRDADPGQDSFSGSSSGCQDKQPCAGEIRLSILICRQAEMIAAEALELGKAVLRAPPGVLAGSQVQAGRGRVSTEANAECLNEAAVLPHYPEE